MNWSKQKNDFKSALTIEPSRISTQAIRIGFFGVVGGGKSVTAGICAVGITPAPGLIGWIDGEGHRSGWAIDIVADMAVKKYGGTKASWVDRFKVIHIDPPFNPLRVVAAMEALEEIDCKTIILDILTQCWDSDGGYLDLKSDELDKMAGDDEKKRERSAASAAAHIKPWTHQKLVNKVTVSKSNLVLLFQAKSKYNPKIYKPDDFVTPIQESGLTRTAIAVGRVECNEASQGGFCRFDLPPGQGAKHTHYSILEVLPKNGEQFTFDHAAALLNRCSGATPPTATTKKPASELAILKRELWDIAEPVRGSSPETFNQWLIDEAVISDTETLAELGVDRLKQIIPKVKDKIERLAEGITP